MICRHMPIACSTGASARLRMIEPAISTPPETCISITSIAPTASIPIWIIIRTDLVVDHDGRATARREVKVEQAVVIGGPPVADAAGHPHADHRIGVPHRHLGGSHAVKPLTVGGV